MSEHGRTARPPTRAPAFLHDLLDRAATLWPDKEAIVDGDQRHSYRSLAHAATNLASHLQAQQLEIGDRIAIYLDKSFAEATAIFAASITAGAFIPVNPLLKPHQVAGTLIDSRSRFLVTSAERLPELVDALSTCAALETVLLVDEASGEPAELANIDLVDNTLATSAKGSFQPARRNTNDLAAILYTSGSTGMPKGAMLSHANLLAGSRIVTNYLGINFDDRILSVLPMSFDYGLNQLITSVENGATLVLLRFHFGNQIVRAMHDERVTALAGVPSLWALLCDRASKLDERPIPSLRYMTNSGGTMPRETLAKIRAAQPHVDFVLMYGFTEAFRSTWLPPDELDRRPGSMGRAIPETNVFLVDDTDRPCTAGQEGTLVHEGPTTFLGYWERPEETAQVLRPNPIPGSGSSKLVCYSGDRASMDEDGYFYFVGREDAMIKSAGYRISPTEIESVLTEGRGVVEAAVVGIVDDRLGQTIRAFVRCTEHGAGESDLLAHCADRLPRYMVPRTIAFVDELPKTPHGKIDYPSLRESCRQSDDDA